MRGNSAKVLRIRLLLEYFKKKHLVGNTSNVRQSYEDNIKFKYQENVLR